ncbi:CHAT domain-containing protein [Microseira wollei]|nr:CHAT domain-containing protein [Microseira wollei]
MPCLFALSLLLVTAGIPALAQQVTSPNSHIVELGQIVSTAREMLSQQGRQLYEAGQFSAAANLWQQAADLYAKQGAILNQAQTLNYLASAYQELGQWSLAEKAIETSINLLPKNKDSRATAILAQALNNKGSLQLARGQTEAALETWKQAEQNYARAKNEIGKLGSRINQANALQALGQYRRSKILLQQLVGELKNQPDSLVKADGLRSLGIALQTIGDLLQSKEMLEQSWAISQRLGASANPGETLLSIGNIARDLQEYEVARAYYQAAQKKAKNALASVQAQLNLLSLFVQTKQWEPARALVPEIESTISNLSPSRAAIYARVNFAESLMQVSLGAGELGSKWERESVTSVAQILATGVQQAKQISDKRAEAYSLNQLGKLYEQNQQWQDAKNLTQQVLQIAQEIDANDITARAAWQLGRILERQGDITAAIAAYRNAYNNLQSLRSDLVAINPDAQFNFRDHVEPVYREFASLLLQPNANQEDIKQARTVIEALQLAELDNFFRDACLDIQPAQIDEIDTQAAVFYPIILSDRLEVILSLPKQPLRHYSTPLGATQVESILQKMYSSLYLGYSSPERLRFSQQIYDWLIKPAAADLNNSKITTLVFVPDGFLRNLPMAALYDGKQYLVEKYAIALSSGLQLFPQSLERQKPTALTVGLTEARQGFSALPGVLVELKQIAVELNSKMLLDKQFTRQTFQEQMNATSFEIVHLATHGQFSSNPEETFLLTWDDRISIQDFDQFFQKRRVGILRPIELLVLSACQTASGDKRAALGLAGLALRSGASSTLASLWSVNDESTANLMSEFYRQLTQSNSSITKAEALRQAQLALLKNPLFDHPYFWASFVLVGNWL